MPEYFPQNGVAKRLAAKRTAQMAGQFGPADQQPEVAPKPQKVFVHHLMSARWEGMQSVPGTTTLAVLEKVARGEEPPDTVSDQEYEAYEDASSWFNLETDASDAVVALKSGKPFACSDVGGDGYVGFSINSQAEARKVARDMYTSEALGEEDELARY